jgi:hypothetical protein
MEKQDCYFFLEGEEDSDRTIRPSCLACMKDKKIKDAMFWPGRIKGYGPYKYECAFCKKIIYEHGAK